jgi:putative ATP-dependent endonuclease of OLD family
MKILQAQISNYRNLDGINVSFTEDCNFIVGENNLGKSNLLSLLNILFSSRSFHAEDFKDTTVPIKIDLKIKLADIEIGHFEDLFDSDDYSIINISCVQDNVDENITFFHTESQTYIKSSLVRCLNYIHYDLLRNPITEINFDKGRGVGRFLRNIVSHYLKENEITDKDCFEQDILENLLEFINSKTSKIKSFKDFQILASCDNDIENLLSKIVVLKDDKGDSLTKSGYGVQFLILVTLSILEKIQLITQQRKNTAIFEDEITKKKAISLVLGLDEPEIHLHPYMQRSLIKYLNEIINGDNEDFQQLVKELFDIDNFIGQILVVTHSPNIVLNDYRQIIRFYQEKGITKVISGNTISLDEQLQKHLYINFPFIKEAFFSRGIIFVEGDSEYASFPHFAKKINIDFDDLGISIIKANGENSIPPLMRLASKFFIPSVGIVDKDKGKKTIDLPNYFITARFCDFEEEIISPLIDKNNENILRKILCDYDSQGVQRVMQSEALNKRVNKYNIQSGQFTTGLKLEDIELTDIEKLKVFYLTWYSITKSYPLGKLIGEQLTCDQIPKIYKVVIKKAKKLVQNV